MKKIALILSILTFYQPITTWAQRVDRGDLRPLNYSWKNTANELSIVSYNVQNLFDIEHAEGKNDFEFLPKKLSNGRINKIKQDGCEAMRNEYYKQRCFAIDWTADRLKLKIKQIARALSLQGDMPDVLSLQEVENLQVTQQLAMALGYKAEHVNISTSSDRRGIDVAVIYSDAKLRYLSSGSKEVIISGKEMKTRPIFWSVFQIKGSREKLAVFAVHWPSQGGSAATRMAAAKALLEAMKVVKNRYKSLHVLVNGDFNTTRYDRPHAIVNVLDKGTNALHDSMTILLQEDKNTFYRMALGSYFYKRSMNWNYFDKILVSESLLENKSDLTLDKNSFRILAMEEITQTHVETYDNNHSFANVIHGTPLPYDHTSLSPSKAGFSDHFPVRAILKIK